MTNRLDSGKLSIMKCDSCADGYLIVKSSKDGLNHFLACTNYTANGKGCGNIVWKEDFYRMMGYEVEKK